MFTRYFHLFNGNTEPTKAELNALPSPYVALYTKTGKMYYDPILDHIDRANSKVGDIMVHDPESGDTFIVDRESINALTQTFDLGRFIAVGVVVIPPSLNIYGNGQGAICGVQKANGGTNTSWGPTNEDIQALPNYDTADKALGDFKGLDNTGVITAMSAIGSAHPAADACKAYVTKGTTAGQWYLPACGELMSVVGKYDTSTGKFVHDGGQKTLIDRSFEIAAKLVNSGVVRDTGSDFWSSSERDGNSGAWFITFSRGSVDSNGKNGGKSVRPFMRF